MPRLTKNFTTEEFACPCCGQCNMDPEFMGRLQAVRTEYGKRMSVISGYRCEIQDGKKGAHTEGKAVDPGVPREDYHTVMRLAFAHGFTGIGVKQKDGRHQLHLDTADAAPGRPRPWVWTY